jgi:hypothetical protein
VNCKTAGSTCSFSTNESPPSTTESASAAVDSEASETSIPSVTKQDANLNTPVTISKLPDYSYPVLNMQHLELLHHYCTDTYRTFAPDISEQEVWRSVVVRMGLSHPFLMHELLAMAALHLAYCHSDNAAWYTTKATELQTQALRAFNMMQETFDASNCAPLLLFTSLLGFHILCDPSRTKGLNSYQYLDHVIDSVMLMRSIRGLVVQDWHQQIRETELKPLFDIKQPVKPYDLPQACIDLEAIAYKSDLSSETSEVYVQAIEKLQWVLCVAHIPYQMQKSIRWLLAWPISTPKDYLELLSQRRPEALIILAYFGALMVFYRECWAVGDSGSYLIQAISSQLGPRWQKWMQWPMSILLESEVSNEL